MARKKITTARLSESVEAYSTAIEHRPQAKANMALGYSILTPIRKTRGATRRDARRVTKALRWVLEWEN